MAAVAGQIATNKFFPGDTIHAIYIYISRSHGNRLPPLLLGLEKIELVLLSRGRGPPLRFDVPQGRRTFSAERKAEFRDIVSVSIPPIKRHVWSGTQLALEHGQKPRRFGYLFPFRKVKPKLNEGGGGSQHLPVGNYRVANGFWQFIVRDREDEKCREWDERGMGKLEKGDLAILK